MIIRAGQLDEMVTIERYTEVSDGHGSTLPEWKPLANRWVKIEAEVSREFQSEGKDTHLQRYRVTGRAFEGLTEEDRFRWRDHILEIQGILPAQNRREMVVVCSGRREESNS